MSERGRKAAPSAETSLIEDVKDRPGTYAAAAAIGAGIAAPLTALAIQDGKSEAQKRREIKDKERTKRAKIREAAKTTRTRAARGGGGGGMPTTTGLVGKAVEKFFKRT